ncbi:MAG: large subunit ribosomal protein [Actinomycetota bacterium]|jgi:large subunit ribosomal protein L23|nr:large subunit ribosomal protein [Actinomycetota bacterium]
MGSTKSDFRDVILAPVVSEKSYSLIDQNAYTFLVHPDANKTEIRQAVEQIWGVKVVSVNTVNRKGKSKRFRYTVGKRQDTKRAIVKLAPDDKIEIFGSQGG